MGYLWKVSLIVSHVPSKFYSDIVSYLLDRLPECSKYLIASKETGGIELVDFEVFENFDFANRFKVSLRDKIWSFGFIKFYLNIELSESENSEFYDIEEYEEFLMLKSNFNAQKFENQNFMLI